MYHSISIAVKDEKLIEYFDTLSKNYNNMINVTHYHIRQCMTGLKKLESERFDNEKEVINGIAAALPLMNGPKLTKDGRPKKTKLRKVKPNAKKQTKPKEKTGFEMPTAEKWFLGKYFLDAYFKVTKNADYYNLPAQVNQDAITDAIESWTGYFEKLKSEANTDKPNPPHYRKSGGYATVTLSNQICTIKKNKLTFPKTKLTLDLGNVNFLKYTLKETKVKRVYGTFYVVMTLDDGAEAPAISEEPKRILGIDLGVSNIVTISNNIGLTPIVVKGGVIKSYNQWFNKKCAELQSDIDKKIENIRNGLNAKEQKDAIFAYRSRFIKDIFHKISNFIIDYSIENTIDAIVIGKSNGWKHESNMDRERNQAFCMIPHNQLIDYIQYKAEAAGIKVIINEESYTSKASFLDNNYIPTYGQDIGKQKFSGSRVKRGLYKSKNGTLLNADVNGASNIIRKAIPEAFDGIKDFSYLWKTVISKKYHDFTVLPKYKYPCVKTGS